MSASTRPDRRAVVVHRGGYQAVEMLLLANGPPPHAELAQEVVHVQLSLPGRAARPARNLLRGAALMSAAKHSTDGRRLVHRKARYTYQALETLLADDQLHAELAQRGRARAAEFTTWTRSADRLKTCFEELL